MAWLHGEAVRLSLSFCPAFLLCGVPPWCRLAVAAPGVISAFKAEKASKSPSNPLPLQQAAASVLLARISHQITSAARETGKAEFPFYSL